MTARDPEVVTAAPPRTGRHGRRARDSVAGLVPVGLVVVAEAAWISVVGGITQAFAIREPVLGMPVIAAFVVSGIVAARLVGRRLGRRWPFMALALAVLAAIVGWSMSPATRDALSDGIGAAIAAHPAGWIAGLAMVRGFAHAELPLREDTVARLLALGVPFLAAAAILGGAFAEPIRGRLLFEILFSSIVFIVAATVAATLTRLIAIGQDAGFDWRRNPAWLGLSVALIVVAIVAAVPLSTFAGIAIGTLVTAALGPLLVIGLLTGLDRTMRRGLIVVFGIGLILLVLVRVFGKVPTVPLPTTGQGDVQSQPSLADQLMTISLGGVLLVGAIVLVLVLAAVWLDRTRPVDDDLVVESRTIDRGIGAAMARRRRRRFVRRADPADAAAAYVALVTDLDRHPPVRREPGETPAEHAARLRTDGNAALSMDLLAADYALARYGGVPLPDREDRRAVARWRDLRRRLVRRRTGP
jgi:uncharacterized protein DUF4129